MGISNISTARWSKLIGPNPKVSTRLKASPKTCSQLSILSICSLNRGRKVGFLWPRTREAIYFKVFLGDYSTVFFFAQAPQLIFFSSTRWSFQKPPKNPWITYWIPIYLPQNPKTNINPWKLKVCNSTSPCFLGLSASYSRGDLVSFREGKPWDFSHHLAALWQDISLTPKFRTTGGLYRLDLTSPPRVPVTSLRFCLKKNAACHLVVGCHPSQRFFFDPNL